MSVIAAMVPSARTTTFEFVIARPWLLHGCRGAAHRDVELQPHAEPTGQVRNRGDPVPISVDGDPPGVLRIVVDGQVVAELGEHDELSALAGCRLEHPTGRGQVLCDVGPGGELSGCDSQDPRHASYGNSVPLNGTAARS